MVGDQRDPGDIAERARDRTDQAPFAREYNHPLLHTIGGAAIDRNLPLRVAGALREDVALEEGVAGMDAAHLHELLEVVELSLRFTQACQLCLQLLILLPQRLVLLREVMRVSEVVDEVRERPRRVAQSRFDWHGDVQR